MYLSGDHKYPHPHLCTVVVGYPIVMLLIENGGKSKHQLFPSDQHETRRNSSSLASQVLSQTLSLSLGEFLLSVSVNYWPIGWCLSQSNPTRPCTPKMSFVGPTRVQTNDVGCTLNLRNMILTLYFNLVTFYFLFCNFT